MANITHLFCRNCHWYAALHIRELWVATGVAFPVFKLGNLAPPTLHDIFFDDLMDEKA